MFEKREGERALAEDPAISPADGQVVFIGRIRSAWKKREDCPKNMRAARERGEQATIEIALPYRPGIDGLTRASHVIVLTWFHHAPRNLIVQKPRHATEAKGVFAIRSPVRPNPIGLHIARLLAVDEETGVLTLDAMDALDGTPVIDIKPYIPTVDVFADASFGKD
ncbi:tRNA (N6-threonylcarbamoyladenosine(37)-N6)-methyltransferase TrmO [Pseudaminobacter arsenicus]|uniref:tRNA (N6-threonylcarbamoyladenosine(37)-N6)-methyltransferase TrmO n=1 Tax=Borborobacter arsenicus TaxID=1851146 RepID=A0A432VCA3_9HYPH|nr:tRNA (N6-threonylcarbamoyladenosine(37)-N6)-methyltransferase TrmO [Pseudaminobacter arsenicus]RUM99807.1 tRNA (N6-threonylcarbamoyladenosine(37)-N6)-methyltransferase TrmO [Pseudaminobacter arsenicus]